MLTGIGAIHRASLEVWLARSLLELMLFGLTVELFQLFGSGLLPECSPILLVVALLRPALLQSIQGIVDLGRSKIFGSDENLVELLLLEFLVIGSQLRCWFYACGQTRVRCILTCPFRRLF